MTLFDMTTIKQLSGGIMQLPGSKVKVTVRSEDKFSINKYDKTKSTLLNEMIDFHCHDKQYCSNEKYLYLPGQRSMSLSDRSGSVV